RRSNEGASSPTADPSRGPEPSILTVVGEHVLGPTGTRTERRNREMPRRSGLLGGLGRRLGAVVDGRRGRAVRWPPGASSFGRGARGAPRCDASVGRAV